MLSMLDPWSVALEVRLMGPTDALPSTSLGDLGSLRCAPRSQHTGQPLKMSGPAWSLPLLTLLIPHWAHWGVEMQKPRAPRSGKAEEEPE